MKAMVFILVLALLAPLAAQKPDKPPTFKHAYLELLDGSKHRSVLGTVTYEAEAITFTATSRREKKYNRAVRYADIVTVNAQTNSSPNETVAALSPIYAMVGAHQKFLTLKTADGNYTVLRIKPSTYMFAIAELEKRKVKVSGR